MKKMFNVDECPRCCGVHPRLMFKKLVMPVRPENGSNAEFPFWALCPVTHEPVLATGKAKEGAKDAGADAQAR